MLQPQINKQEESDIRKFSRLFIRNRILFISSLLIAILVAFSINQYSIPVYSISSSILIKENQINQNRIDANDYLNSSLFDKNQNFQNELWVIKSSPVIDQTIRNLGLEISYYRKSWFLDIDSYQNVPFQVFFLPGHAQPLNVRFKITFLKDGYLKIKAETKGKVDFYNFETERISHQKEGWSVIKNARYGELIETPDFAFLVRPDTINSVNELKETSYEFDFKTVPYLRDEIRDELNFKVANRLSTIIELNMKSQSVSKGIDIVNEIMNVYSGQNLDRKNHIASITIDYIEKQLDEISDSLSRTEDNLQKFRSSNQLLNINEQAAGISAQYMDLQNKLAELVSRKRYYDYVSEYLNNNVDFSNMMLPAALGIQDELLNNLMSELIEAQSQRSNLIENNQQRNPLVQTLGIKIENVKKTISENILAVGKSTGISIDEMNKRIARTKSEISRIPGTQRLLGNIERKYRLNDAIYNYLMEKRAEAKITKASNLPDNIIIEPAKMSGLKPVSPNKQMNYLIALFLGIVFPLSYLTISNSLSNKIDNQDDLEKLTTEPVLGKILHNQFRTSNIMAEFPQSTIAESFRTLRTNLSFYVRGDQRKIIMVTSCVQSEGKTFVAFNLAMSYAQLGRKTILIDFDLRKQDTYFEEQGNPKEGLSSYLVDKIRLEDVIRKSPHDNLDYILSGILPPNPVELLALEKTRTLLSRLTRDYDIIILDTTPLAQVTDAYLLIDQADLKIVVARQNFTFRKVFSMIMNDLKDKNISNVCIVLNDNRSYRNQYGYGYGYNNNSFKKRNKEERKKMGKFFISESIK